MPTKVLDVLSFVPLSRGRFVPCMGFQLRGWNLIYCSGDCLCTRLKHLDLTNVHWSLSSIFFMASIAMNFGHIHRSTIEKRWLPSRYGCCISQHQNSTFGFVSLNLSTWTPWLWTMVSLLLGGTSANKAIVVVEGFLLLNVYRIHNLFFDFFFFHPF